MSKCNFRKIAFVSIIVFYYIAAFLLLWGGVGKIISPGLGDILETLYEMGLLGAEQVIFVSRWFPLLEIIVAVTAVIGFRADISAKVMGGMYIGFTLLILYVSRGYLFLPIDCGCFGEGEAVPVYLLLIRNIAITIPLFFFTSAHQHYTLYSRLKSRE